MKNKFFMLFVVLTLAWTSACASLGRLSPAYTSFDHGRTLFNQGRFDEAIPYLEDATRDDPEFAQAYLYLGRAYISQSRWRAAIQPLRAAFRLAPTAYRLRQRSPRRRQPLILSFHPPP